MRIILSAKTGGRDGSYIVTVSDFRFYMIRITRGQRRTTGSSSAEWRFFSLLEITWRMALRSVRSGWKFVRSRK